MWIMYAAVWRMVDGETYIDEEMIEAETLDDLVRRCQSHMDNRDGLFIFWPDPNNPSFWLQHYAALIGMDVPYGRDQTIKGHFAIWVRYGRIIVRPLYSLKRDARYREN